MDLLNVEIVGDSIEYDPNIFTTDRIGGISLTSAPEYHASEFEFIGVGGSTTAPIRTAPIRPASELEIARLRQEVERLKAIIALLEPHVETLIAMADFQDSCNPK